MKTIGIIIAVKDEAKEIINDRIFKWEKIHNDTYKSSDGLLYLTITGIGKAYAVYGLSKIADNCDFILSMGTSGGLGHEPVGSIYYCEEFVEHDMDVTGLGVPAGVTPFSKMKSPVISGITDENRQFIREILEELNIDYKTGRTISGDLFISNPETAKAKKNLFDANLADMESAGIAKICATVIEKDFAAIRYITDNADHDASNNWQENVKKSAVTFNNFAKKIHEKITR